ncbi:hypothetical protein AAVH_20571 [Aphelenchoides avenae]|nr:hypothetical protein AAVH_20571 [Aphelenchus avenae]
MFLSMTDTSALPSTITIPWFPYHRYTDSLEIVDTYSVQSKASLSGGYEVTVYEPIRNPSTGHVLKVFSSLDALPARNGPFVYPTFECPTPAENETNLLFIPEYKNYEGSKFRYAL